jgi:hypothetical protein
MFSRLAPPDASAAYRQVTRGIATYLEEMEVPRSIIELMDNTSSGDIRWIDAISDRVDHPPSIAEWADASCGSGNEFYEALRNGTFEQLPSRQQEFLKLQYSKKVECEGSLIGDHRGRLAPP